jgi:hypothetical protein
MTSRGPAVAWTLASSTALLVAAGLILLALTLDEPPQGGWGFRGFPTIFAIGSGVVGWLIMVRQPNNRIGLVLAFVGLLNGAQLFLTEYASAGLHQSLPASNVAAWVNAFIWVPTLTLMAGATTLLFPDGRLPSPRWRLAGWMLAVGAILVTAIIAIYPNALNTPRLVQRVIQVQIDDSTLNNLAYIGIAILGIGIVLSAGSLLLRWRRAKGVVREQLKWLAASAVLVAITMWLSVLPSPIANAIFIFAIGTVPIAVGIAVLRHRLYDIDTVISRTLVYGALTAILTGAFAALQRLLQAVFVGATGNESDAAIVITTLVLATSFAPLKREIEKFVERRFKDTSGSRATAATSAASAGAEGSTNGSGGTVTAWPADIEVLLRRVVREEIRDALADATPALVPGVELTAAAEPANIGRTG